METTSEDRGANLDVGEVDSSPASHGGVDALQPMLMQVARTIVVTPTVPEPELAADSPQQPCSCQDADQETAARAPLPREIQELGRRLEDAVREELRHFAAAVSSAPLPDAPPVMAAPNSRVKGSGLRLQRALAGRPAPSSSPLSNCSGGTVRSLQVPQPRGAAGVLMPGGPLSLKGAVSKLRTVQAMGPTDVSIGSGARSAVYDPSYLASETPTSTGNGLRRAASAGRVAHADEPQSPTANDLTGENGVKAAEPLPPAWPSPKLDITDVDELQTPGCPAQPTDAAMTVPTATPQNEVKKPNSVLRARKAAGLQDKFRAAAWSSAAASSVVKLVVKKGEDEPGGDDTPGGDGEEAGGHAREKADAPAKRRSRASGRRSVPKVQTGYDSESDDEKDGPTVDRGCRTAIRNTVEMDFAHTRWGKSLLREAVPEKSWLHKRVTNHVVSNQFDFVMCVILLLNAVTIGVQVEYTAQQDGRDVHDAEPPSTFTVFEQLFCAIFTVELALRVYVFRWAFFGREDWRWNTFDTLMVSMQLFEEIARVAVGSGTGNATDSAESLRQLKMLRTLKLLKALRVLRIVKFIQELANIMYLIIGSFWSFIWTFALLSLLTYISGTFVTQLVSDHVTADTDASEAASLREHYGSIGRSVMSFFMAITGGVDWKDLSEPLSPISGLMVWLFAIYVAFGALVMLNLVTGVFVDGARDLREKDKHMDLTRKLHTVLDLAAIRAGGDITWEEFQEHLHQPQLADFFDALSIDRSEAKTVFDLLDVDGGGVISAEEFVLGGLRLQGPAKAIEVAKISLENQILTKSILEELGNIHEVLGSGKTSAQIAPT